jgi:hypothetical protein
MAAKKSKSSGKKEFKSLSPTQKRIAIAEDVIGALKAKRYKATCGTYVYSTATAKGFTKKNESALDIDLQEILKANMKSCEVCAKGAMFVAAVERFDKLKIDVYDSSDRVLADFDGDESVCDHLSNYFDQDQLDLIECAFEGGEFMESHGIYEEGETDWAARGYEHKYPNAHDRMIAIMENIIRNKGKFICSPKELFK